MNFLKRQRNVRFATLIRFAPTQARIKFGRFACSNRQIIVEDVFGG